MITPGTSLQFKMRCQTIEIWCLLIMGCALLKFIETARTPAEDQKLAEQYARLHPNNATYDQEDTGGDCHTGDILDFHIGSGRSLGVRDRNELWTEGTVNYQYNRDAPFTQWEMKNIEAAMSEIENLTKFNGSYCVRFLPRTNTGSYTTIQKNDSDSCASTIGRNRRFLRINLSHSCVTKRRMIIHELLHALGLYHEHMRPDRDLYVSINWENIMDGTQINFAKLPTSKMDQFGTSYDYRSILHYNAYAYAKNKSIPTITPLDPSVEIGKTEAMSPNDIERVKRLYRCGEETVPLRGEDCTDEERKLYRCREKIVPLPRGDCTAVQRKLYRCRKETASLRRDVGEDGPDWNTFGE